MNSTKIAEALNYRQCLPPIVTVPHVQTLLSVPSAVEREITELARSGFLRKIIVARCGDIGETLVLSTDLDTHNCRPKRREISRLFSKHIP